MHSRKHGKSGSKKPEKKKHAWLMYEPAEIEKLIVKLAKEGKQNSDIGTILRDQYGIPDVRSLDIRVAKVTEKEVKKEVPDDMYNLIKKAITLRKHLNNNHHDAKATHGLELLESKIRRMGKYYSRTGKIASDWKYDPEKAKLLVK
jgi:small subunit ribosomal protein S15